LNAVGAIEEMAPTALYIPLFPILCYCYFSAVKWIAYQNLKKGECTVQYFVSEKLRALINNTFQTFDTVCYQDIYERVFESASLCRKGKE